MNAPILPPAEHVIFDGQAFRAMRAQSFTWEQHRDDTTGVIRFIVTIPDEPTRAVYVVTGPKFNGDRVFYLGKRKALDGVRES